MLNTDLLRAIISGVLQMENFKQLFAADPTLTPHFGNGQPGLIVRMVNIPESSQQSVSHARSSPLALCSVHSPRGHWRTKSGER